MTSNYWNRYWRQRASRRLFMAGASTVAAGAAGVALVGCGDDDDDDDDDDDGGNTPAAGPTATPQASGPAQGGVYKRSTTSTPNFVRMPLNTAGNNTPMNQWGGLFNRLVRVGGSDLSPEPGYDNVSRMTGQDFDVVSDLAEDWEQVDELTYTFNIRGDAHWHSGRVMTAEDIAFTWEAIKDPDVGGGGSPLNLMAVNLEKTEAINDTTVQMTLKQPTGYFMTLASQTNIADRETLAQVEDGVLVGTGPFKFDNYDPNRGYDLVANEDYHLGRPLLDKIEFTLFADGGTAGLALEAGDVHAGTFGTPEIEARLTASPNHYGIIPTGQGCRVLRLRADVAPTSDKRVRQGIMLIADSVRVAEEFGGTFDAPGRLPWQPSSAAYDAELDKPVFDPQKARELFDAAGLTDGGKLKADVLPERLTAPALAQIMQQELSAMGIELEINNREYTEMITLQTTGSFEHMILGFGNWMKPGDPAVTVLFADAYDGRMNALADENVPLAERPGIKEEPEWLDMIEQAKNGTWTDWRAWNEKYLDVAWSNVLWRYGGLGLYANEYQAEYDAEGWPYVMKSHIAQG